MQTIPERVRLVVRFRFSVALAGMGRQTGQEMVVLAVARLFKLAQAVPRKMQQETVERAEELRLLLAQVALVPLLIKAELVEVRR